jgi:hypothetical protein
MLAGRFDLWPVPLRPLRHRCQRCIERSADMGQLVERGGLDPVQGEVAADEPVAFGFAERLRQDLVRDAIKGPVEVLVAAAFPCQLGKHCKRPASRQ